MLVNTAEIRTRIQAEIDNHLARAASLQEKLALLGQIETLVNEAGFTEERLNKVLAVPELKLEPKLEAKLEPRLEVSTAIPHIEPAFQEMPPPAKEGGSNAQRNPWAFMQQGFQAYLSGKLDKALELFKEARDLNPTGFEKTWTTMTSIPIYSSVARDKHFTDSLFTSK
jgi:hypothetical protein